MGRTGNRGSNSVFKSVAGDHQERKITLVVDPRLLPILALPGITVVGQGKDLSQHGHFDYQGPIGQLGSLLRQTAISFSNAPERFLTPDAER
jgi:hypothetical protein